MKLHIEGILHILLQVFHAIQSLHSRRFQRLMSKVKPGSIKLCHNNSDNILDALPLMLERLINAGYIVGSVGELIYNTDYHIDNLGVQRKNN